MARPMGVRFRKALKKLRPQREPDLVAVPDQVAGPGRDQDIPRVVFQTAESRLVHPTHAKSIDEFRRLNPDLAFQMFDASERDSYMSSTWALHPIREVYERAIFGQMKADVFRYCIVFERGGYYFDFNKGCKAPLAKLHPPEAEGLVSYESNPELIFPPSTVASALQNPFNLLLQWGFGFRREHPLLLQVIERIVEVEPFFRQRGLRQPKSGILTMSGPGIFTSTFRRYVRTHGLGSIVEAGEDFNRYGIFRLRGSKILDRGQDYYGEKRDQIIVSGPPDGGGTEQDTREQAPLF